jgi:heme/copper-type cytochrome/quinol oxidase subunit 2
MVRLGFLGNTDKWAGSWILVVLVCLLILAFFIYVLYKLKTKPSNEERGRTYVLNAMADAWATQSHEAHYGTLL